MSKEIQDSIQHQMQKQIDAAQVEQGVEAIFESAKNWTLQQFYEKILAGIVDYNPSYIAIAIELLSTVTGLEEVENFTTLWFFFQKTQELDTVTIKKAQHLFW
jgi:outer membrane cobalamin receptor